MHSTDYNATSIFSTKPSSDFQLDETSPSVGNICFKAVIRCQAPKPIGLAVSQASVRRFGLLTLHAASDFLLAASDFRVVCRAADFRQLLT